MITGRQTLLGGAAAGTPATPVLKTAKTVSGRSGRCFSATAWHLGGPEAVPPASDRHLIAPDSRAGAVTVR